MARLIATRQFTYAGQTYNRGDEVDAGRLSGDRRRQLIEQHRVVEDQATVTTSRRPGRPRKEG